MKNRRLPKVHNQKQVKEFFSYQKEIYEAKVILKETLKRIKYVKNEGFSSVLTIQEDGVWCFLFSEKEFP